MTKKCNFLLLSISFLILLVGCVPTSGSKSKPESSSLTICPEQRPQVCTREYRPVCGELKDGNLKTYANGCEACADANVIGFQYGECAAVSTQ